MVKCWAEKPDKRPPFETLRQELDDFEISMEDDYIWSDDDIWEEMNRQNAIKSRQKNPSKEEMKRQNAIQSRQKNPSKEDS